ncbi:hypothetical protein L4D06_03285 [Enterovibrio makurazakiensis]|uniref:Spore coat protein U domain-containing protein n=1 Tax=Enterovibrio gelatinilyticus TaxID=2899819 RepID=A0ABT5R2Q4_9GAMM|nr:hypothetical protein [Enterovibrio sp. ZSDZ42]MDD1794552.1 hypothetical protein [Enterovibrio sp. ZSDZ42]
MWINSLPALFMTFFSATALADSCSASLLNLKPMLSANTYDVFSSSSFPLIKQYHLQSDIPEGCVVEVVIEVDEGTTWLKSSKNAEMRFEYFAETGNLIAGKWRMQLDANMAEAIFELRYPDAQWLEAGKYRGLLKATLFPINSIMELDQITLPIASNVLPSARIQFYGLTQRHYNLDLGSLKTNKIINYAPRLWVESTAPYSLSAESQFKGKLRHQSQNAKWDLDYTMRIANEQIALDDSNNEWKSSYSTDGTPLPIQIIIGNTERKAGGRYTDTVHIHIEPDLSYMP